MSVDEVYINSTVSVMIEQIRIMRDLLSRMETRLEEIEDLNSPNPTDDWLIDYKIGLDDDEDDPYIIDPDDMDDDTFYKYWEKYATPSCYCDNCERYYHINVNECTCEYCKGTAPADYRMD